MWRFLWGSTVWYINYLFCLVHQGDRFTLSDHIISAGDDTCLNNVSLDIFLLTCSLLWMLRVFVLCFACKLLWEEYHVPVCPLLCPFSCLCSVSYCMFLLLSVHRRFSSTSGEFIFVSNLLFSYYSCVFQPFSCFLIFAFIVYIILFI